MATLGKILVIVFAALSLAVLTWSFGVYTQRIRFTETAKDSTPGIFKVQREKTAELSANADRAFVRWSGNLGTVSNLEQQERYPRRAFYAIDLYLIRYGEWFNPKARQVEKVAEPVQVLVFAPNRYLDISKPVGRPPELSRVGGAPLDCVVTHDAKMAKLATDIDARHLENETAITERKKLNDEIVGIREPKLIKGLRQLISEQKTIEEQANMEDTYAADFVTNREAEFGLLKKRRDAMTARMEELERDPELKLVPPVKKGLSD